MFRNYFKTAWRNLLKNKFYSSINICGLAIGLTVGIMILLWVQHEYSYDNFHEKAARTYRINSLIGTGESKQVWETSPGALAMFCKQFLSEVESAVRINNVNEQVVFKYNDKRFAEKRLAFVDSNFFAVFNFKLTAGNSAAPFPNKNSVIVTKSIANKYFGNKDAIGKVLQTEFGLFTVSGVMQDFPDNSNLNYSMLLPMSFYAQSFESEGGNSGWKTIDEDLGNFYFQTYVVVRQQSSAEAVAKKLSSIYKQKKGKDADENMFALQSLLTLHRFDADGNMSSLQRVKVMLAVALLILLIACINYVNLSTARSMVRSREVSIRKVVGANRLQLFLQFIIETTVIFSIASILAFVSIYLLLPLYNSVSGKQLVLTISNKNVWLVIVSSLLSTLLLAGIYPALLLSSFKPIETLKGKITAGIDNTSFRKGLVVTQFIFSVGLIIGTLIIGRQLKYIREKDPGYNKEHVFSFALQKEVFTHLDVFRNELKSTPGILSVASSGSNILGEGGKTGDTDWEGKEKDKMFLINRNSIDENLIPTLQMKMIAGKNFTGPHADSLHYILNETAIKETSIQDPIGKRFTLNSRKGTIIGVVRDFHFTTFKQKIEPYIFYYRPVGGRMYIKTTGIDAQKAITAAERTWKNYESEYPFEYTFLDEDFKKMYEAEQRTGLLFNVFAVVAIVISCLGLLGLSTYTAQAKTKEIGIRKVLGAGITNIVTLLAREFVVLVFISFVITAPVAWWFMHHWLQDFAYRINISWSVFAVSGLLTLLIALITVSFQAIKAAIANPVKSLRTE